MAFMTMKISKEWTMRERERRMMVGRRWASPPPKIKLGSYVYKKSVSELYLMDSGNFLKHLEWELVLEKWKYLWKNTNCSNCIFSKILINYFFKIMSYTTQNLKEIKLCGCIYIHWTKSINHMVSGKIVAWKVNFKCWFSFKDCRKFLTFRKKKTEEFTKLLYFTPWPQRKTLSECLSLLVC